MTLFERGAGGPRQAYSWRRTLLFFVFAALLGWAGVFGAIYTTLVVLDLIAAPEVALEVDQMQKIAPAAGDARSPPR
jgi:hypothetical protein